MDFKVRCIDNFGNTGSYTVDSIYTVKNGSLINNYGDAIGSGRFKTINDLNSWSSSTFELVEEKKMFTKADLKNGDVIKKRNGHVEIVCLETGTLITKNCFNELAAIKCDLTSCDGTIYDIVAVRRPINPIDCRFDAFENNRGELVYDRERDTVREMTVDEIEKALGYKVKVVSNEGH